MSKEGESNISHHNSPGLATYQAVSEATLADDVQLSALNSASSLGKLSSAQQQLKRVKDYFLLRPLGKEHLESQIGRTWRDKREVEVKETLEDAKQIFLVMEYAAGGDLYDFIKRNKPRKDTGYLLRSPYYAAPEMIRGTPYVGPEVDIWSLGVILYAMLMGSLPFDHSDQSQMYSLILRGSYTPLENDLIARMLTVDPILRAKMRVVMEHPWTNVNYPIQPNSYITEHPTVVLSPNMDAVAELVTYGISESEVLRMLSIDCGLHPIKSLYFLVDDYLQRTKHLPSHTGAIPLHGTNADDEYTDGSPTFVDHDQPLHAHIGAPTPRYATAQPPRTAWSPIPTISIITTASLERPSNVPATRTFTPQRFPNDDNLPPLPPKIAVNSLDDDDDLPVSTRRSGVYRPSNDSSYSFSASGSPSSTAGLSPDATPSLSRGGGKSPAPSLGKNSKSPKDKILKFLKATRRSGSSQ
ncbi:hypothetical protein BC829DRAFT_414910 [Chytridium lagenaria]|nr:hypothetical protein BC829DRAFT_414910 [Chytridium lagenaria]